MSTYLDKKAEALRSSGSYRTLPDLTLEGKYVRLSDGRRLLNLSGNDYLGLAADTDLARGFDHLRYPHSASSSRLLTGNDTTFSRFEHFLERTYGVESALVWGSGFHANSGLIPVLSDARTLILVDRLVHASIIDGLRLSGMPFVRFRHNDMAHLTQLVREKGEGYENIWVVTESIFSMDGDRAPLRELVRLKHTRPGLFLYIDEAHSVGVDGLRGLGAVHASGLIQEVDLLLGTLGKALGSVGAFTLQSSVLRELIVNTARPFIYSTALPPLVTAWSHYLFEAMMERTEARRHLASLRALVSDRLKLEAPSQIIPILTPGTTCSEVTARRLTEAGFYIRPIRKPTVPEGQERIRLSLSASLTHDEVDQLCQSLCSVRSHLQS